jgi:hypothetical protein
MKKKLACAVACVLGCGSASNVADGGITNDASFVDASDAAIADAASPVDAMNDAHDAHDASDAGASTGLLVPLYTDPTDGTWTTLIQTKNAHPSVDVVAIINPDSGPGNAKSASYATGITNLESAGIVVVGYVPTGYGTKSYSATTVVEASIDAYVSFYPNIEGIFFDEMSTSASEETYYQTLATYVASKNLALTIGNPGTNVPDALVGIFTNLVIYEDQNMPTMANVDAYRSTYGTAGFSYIAYGVSALPSTSTLQTLDAYVRWVYVTDLGGANPYDALPSYLAAEVAALE